jgi:hypothetical protein
MRDAAGRDDGHVVAVVLPGPTNAPGAVSSDSTEAAVCPLNPAAGPFEETWHSNGARRRSGSARVSQ